MVPVTNPYTIANANLARIFSSLALFATGLFVANLFLGLFIGDFGGAAHRLVAARKKVREMEGRDGDRGSLDEARKESSASSQSFAPVRRRATFHKLFGIAASLVAILVNCISFTYFMGTSRWCQEVVDTYGLDPALAVRSRWLKRQCFPWSLGGIIAVIAIAAMGGASDPGSNLERSAAWVTPHLLTAFMGVAFVSWSYFMQVGYVAENLRIIDEVMQGVQNRRAVQEVAAPEMPMGS